VILTLLRYLTSISTSLLGHVHDARHPLLLIGQTMADRGTFVHHH
jgi:hypothetical protein